MSVFFISLLVLIDLSLIFAFCFSLIKQDNLRTQVLAFLFQNIIIQTAYIFTFLAKDPFINRIIHDFLLISVVFFLLFFMLYISDVTQYIFDINENRRKLNSTLLNIQNKFPLLLAFIDLVFVAADIHFQYLYELKCITPVNHWFTVWRLEYGSAFAVHISIYSVYLTTLSVMTARKIFRTNYLFRKAFINLSLVFAVMVFLNFMFLYDQLRIDVSFLCYAYMGICFWYYNYFELKREQKEYIVSLVSNDITNAVACFDYQGLCIYSNETATKLFGSGVKAAKNLEEYVSSSWFSEYIDDSSNSIYGDDSFEINGEEHYFHIEYRKFIDSKGKIFGSFLKLEDTTEEYQKYKIAKYRAVYDELTGVYNRRTFFEKVEELLREEPDVPRYMVTTNILNFKLLNDLFGSRLGDTVLKKQAEQLSKAKYNTVILGRISSDKFGMFIRVSDFKADLAVQNTKNIENITKSLNYRIKVYIGVYEVLNPTESAASMCDKALLAIKQIHGDYEQTLSFYNSTMMEGILKDKNILSDFPQALRNGEFKMYLQPITDANGNCNTAEALVRWQHPLIGTLAPNYFLESLEKTSYIFTLDSFIWERAVQKIKEWQDAGHTEWSISINISTLSFLYSDLYIVLTDLVEMYQIPPSKLILQIQEDVLSTDKESRIEIITSLKQFGFTCEIDNYGDGSSSLNLHREIDFDGIRLDMNFMNSSRDFNRAKVIAKQVFNIAKSLNMNVTVVDINTKEELDMLKKVGCNYYQGFYFGKALTVEEFEEKYIGGRVDD